MADANVSEKISDDVKQLSFEIAAKHKLTIKHMETDKDHIHYMIKTDPIIRLSDFIRTIKSYTTFPHLENRRAYSQRTLLERANILDRWLFCMFH